MLSVVATCESRRYTFHHSREIRRGDIIEILSNDSRLTTLVVDRHIPKAKPLVVTLKDQADMTVTAVHHPRVAAYLHHRIEEARRAACSMSPR